MPRRKFLGVRPIEYCLVCGDKARGINFNALTCMSCKAFFQRNAPKVEQLECPFSNQCQVNMITRKFCTKCRMKKCLEAGMRKEWILDCDEKLLIQQKKATKYGLRHQKQQIVQQQSQTHQIAPNCNQYKTSHNLFDFSNSFEMVPTNYENVFQHQQTEVFNANTNNFDSTYGSNASSHNSSPLNYEDNVTYQELVQIQFDVDSALDNFPKTCNQTTECCDYLDLSALSHDQPEQHESENTLSTLEPYSAIPPFCTSQFDSIHPQISFPARELIHLEKQIICELLEACNVLENPYHRIMFCNNDYYYMAGGNSNGHQTFRTQYHFNRMVQMSKQLRSFRQFPLSDQVKMMKNSMLVLLFVQSVLIYNPDRECWKFIDDREKTSVLIRMDIIKPFCTRYGFERHRKAPSLFREEWKRDNVIFDLIFAIVLFTPHPDFDEYEKIKEEHTRYTILLRRYLEMIYYTKSEAHECFNQLMFNVVEMSTLVQDVKNFYKSYGPVLQSSPLFAQIFDLKTEHETENKCQDGSSATTVQNSNDNYTDISDLRFLDMF